MQLRRPSDGATSESLQFEYLPLDSGRRSLLDMRKTLKERGNFDLLQRLLSVDSDLLGSQRPNGQDTEDDVKIVKIDQTERSADEVIVLDTPAEDEKPFIATSSLNEATDQIMDVVDGKEKTTEWVEKTEFTLSNEENNAAPLAKEDPNADDDLKLLLEQVAELDEIYADQHLKKEVSSLERELSRLEQAMPSVHADISMDFDEMFDDAATYTSLQRAFKNPVPIIDLFPPSPPNNFDPNDYDAVEPVPLVTPPASVHGSVHEISPLKRESPKLEEEKLPPLPPKRSKKTSQSPDNTENLSHIINTKLYRDNDSLPLTPERRNSMKSPNRPQSQIIIMRTPDQSPLNKRQPPSPKPNSPSNSSTLPKQKKSGFFSKLFSRRKSKSDINSNHNTECKNTPDISREPSINHFDIHDPNRLSTRSIKSLQIPTKKPHGKPVGRSVSSVSGKRPHLTADIVHIPLKGESSDSLPMRSGSGTLLSLPGNMHYGSTVTLSNHLDRRTKSALQLADLPFQDGNMELIAIADAQSLKNLCEGEYGVKLDPSVDLTEAEHYALYTSVAPYATQSEFDENSCYYAPVEGGEILETSEVVRRLNDHLDYSH